MVCERQFKKIYASIGRPPVLSRWCDSKRQLVGNLPFPVIQPILNQQKISKRYERMTHS